MSFRHVASWQLGMKAACAGEAAKKARPAYIQSIRHSQCLRKKKKRDE
jgi:hypothetical protein